jgi:predicted metal-dependent peptidase
MKEWTAEEKSARANFYVMNSPIWVGYAGVIMVGKIEIVDNPFLTAATDGFNVAYGRQFIDGLNEKQVRFVVLHETMHKMFRHLVMWYRLFKLDADRANQACDHVINLLIQEQKDGGVEIPTGIGICLDPKYTGMDSGEVFRLLPPSPPCPGCGGTNGRHAQPGAGGKGCQQGSFDEHRWEEANAPDQKEQERRAQEIDSAIRQGSVLAGQIAGQVPRIFDELMEVPIDWREVMRQFVSTHCRGGDFASFRRPNRKWLAYDMYMPSVVSETIDNVLFCIDTSGSIQGPALNEFVSAGVSALEQVNPARTDLLYWDAAVAAHEVYFQGDAQKMKSSTRPEGGGGTAPSCITQYLAANNMKPTCAIVLTDGYVGTDWGGDWPCPVLWVIKDNKQANPTTGPAVHF